MEPFSKRHLGVSPTEQEAMLREIGASSLAALMGEVVPPNIVSDHCDTLPDPVGEKELLTEIKNLSEKNHVYRSYIGMGYYNTVVPSVILRNLLENPGWYTQYTPYQSEISQGRLESLLNFQTMVMDLTGMEVSNASLLDEATAAAEAMMVMKRASATFPEKKQAKRCLVSRHIFPQTLSVLETRSLPLGIELVSEDPKDFFKDHQGDPTEDCFGMILQFPLENGDLEDYSEVLKIAKAHRIPVTVITDIMSLVWLTPPGEWRVGDQLAVDIVVGSTQRFGVPMGYGGPHAAFISSREEWKRILPGRIIGVTKDVRGQIAYRMSLQTREQHIRREKATSNICTAQALLANMAAMYAVYHGPRGLETIAGLIHLKTALLSDLLCQAGYTPVNKNFFDTLTLSASPEEVEKIHALAKEKKINFRNCGKNRIGLSLDESVSGEDIFDIAGIFYQAKNLDFPLSEWEKHYQILARLERSRDEEEETQNRKEIREMLEKTLPAGKIGMRRSPILTHEIFNHIRSETQMMRYLNELERKDIALNYSMISLGSCTMKLNPATSMIPVSWENFSSIHPFVPLDQTMGYQAIFRFLEKTLAAITGLDAVSLQPNSGAQGEYAGLMAIRDYHLAQGESGKKRDIIIIPTSAHGTNPASAVMAGMKVVLLACLKNGDVDVEDLRAKVEEHRDRIAGLMITYPSTHGVYEERVKEVCTMIHEAGGQVYMDGANMNAQIGLTSPGAIGADVCHLNLHKTFAIPHGGGGPGMGPIAVKKHLAPYLPGHGVIALPGKGGQISATPWGSAGILPISYAYIRLLGKIGITKATQVAILNANYIKSRLADFYPVVYQGKNGRVAHEFIVDIRPFEKTSGINAEDISKRLMDYGFHAPTLSFPIPGTLMIEPTESEDREELDRFCEAMILIRQEIARVEKGEWPRDNNPLVNAPHSQGLLIETWKYPYTQQEAFFPAPFIRKKKFWPTISRVNNVYGDKNFFCACPSPELWADNP